MYIKKLRVYNYKSYFDSGEMEFSPGINIIVGKNNAGKTSLLEVLTLDFEDQPHKSLKTLPNKDSRIEEKSRIKITYDMGKYENNKELSEQDCLDRTLSIDSGDISISNLRNGSYDNSGDFVGDRIKIFLSLMYRFRAERLNIGICKSENNNQLKSDASNLAEVLFILQGKNPGMFANLNKLVSSILPEINWISVVTGDNSNVEIIVWIIDPQLNRDDLSFPLSSCGSGVGQVLAIVYILVCSEEPRTLIIDEPQSFLHPGAAKKLIETIKQFPQHQYFIATHSPEIITTADPSNIIKLQYKNCETTASVIDAKDINLQKEILDELGVRLSDVFGADSILWVEGPTEEKCFPLIIDKFLVEMPLKGMKILSVDSVSGLLDGKHTSLVARLHKQLTSGISLIPEKSIFIFDREGKKPENIKDLERIGFKFLKRPMYENYILNPDAISAIINEEAQETLIEIGTENADYKWLKSPITNIQVQKCFEKIQQDEQYLLKGIENDNWLFKVHGANVIQSVFQELCENQLDFNGNKPKYCRRITEWLIKNRPDFLSELAKELKVCLFH